MNFFQSLNVGVFGLTLAAILGGVARFPGSMEGLPRCLWLFVPICFSCSDSRCCSTISKYFQTAKTKNRFFKVGFVIGAISVGSMGSWGRSLEIHRPPFSSWRSLSQRSRMVVMAKRGHGYREQYIWIFTNVIFVMRLSGDSSARRRGRLGDLDRDDRTCNPCVIRSGVQ